MATEKLTENCTNSIFSEPFRKNAFPLTLNEIEKPGWLGVGKWLRMTLMVAEVNRKGYKSISPLEPIFELSKLLTEVNIFRSIEAVFISYLHRYV